MWSPVSINVTTSNSLLYCWMDSFMYRRRLCLNAFPPASQQNVIIFTCRHMDMSRLGRPSYWSVPLTASLWAPRCGRTRSAYSNCIGRMVPDYTYSAKERTGNTIQEKRLFYTLQDKRAENLETKSVIYEKTLWDAFHHNCDCLD